MNSISFLGTLFIHLFLSAIIRIIWNCFTPRPSETIDKNERTIDSQHDHKDLDIGAILSKIGGSVISNDIFVMDLLDNHFKAADKFEFPQKRLHGCNRSFNYKWFMKYPFLVYSKCLDSVFCLPCVLFVQTKKICS